MRWLFALALLCPIAGAQNFPCSTITPLILSDDNADDPDSMESFYLALKWQDLGCAQVLAITADSSNATGAPAIQAVVNYALHGDVPVGANQANTPSNSNCSTFCNASTWTAPTVTQFSPAQGSTRANYMDCATLWRKQMANAANASVVIVLTGYTPCITQFLATSADGYSSLTGVQMAQQKVKELVIEAGYWSGSDPGGAEANAFNDAPGYNSLLITWTSQNGYPPMYFADFFSGTLACAGPPIYRAYTAEPMAFALKTANQSYGSCATGFQRPTFGQVSILFALWGVTHNGLTYFTASANGTATINASTGISSFSTGTASGQYVLTLGSGGTATNLANLFDCRSPVGPQGVGSYAPCLPPLGGLGALTTGSVHGNASMH